MWLAFTACNPVIGVTLQHYRPDEDGLRRRWEIPDAWRMTGQMPFGRVAGPAWDKDTRADDELIRVYGAISTLKI